MIEKLEVDHMSGVGYRILRSSERSRYKDWISEVALICGGDTDEAKEAACFLAAAPEMFEALRLIQKRLKMEWDSGDMGHQWDYESDPVYASATAALAKAEGR